MRSKGMFAAAASALAMAATVFVSSGARAQDQPRVIAITAKRFGFSPSEITLVKGETVKLQLTSEDVTHGLFLRPLGIEADIPPGQVTELVVTPQKAGTFRAICDHFCGAGHGAMKMTIVVAEPGGTPAAAR
jgi:cytochrome c oxidase subunit II